MNFDEQFNPPFNKKGEPNKYLRLLIPLFSKEFTQKEEMLKLMGVNVNTDKKEWRNKHGTTLWKLNKAGILQAKPRGNGSWRRGANWDQFMAWIMSHMIKNPTTKDKFKDMLIKYDSNTLEFIMKG
jgi:hypothetical protein